MSYWAKLWLKWFNIFINLFFINDWCLYFFLLNIRTKNRIGPHNFDILSLIVGSLLGDSNPEKRCNGTRFRIQQEDSNVEYLMWFHKFLAVRGYCNNNKSKLYKRLDINNKIRFYYNINTYTFNSLNWIHDMFYKFNSEIKNLLK